MSDDESDNGSDDVEEQLQELREKESQGNRLDRENPQNQPDLVDSIEDALEQIDDGEKSDTITAFDPRFAALLEALGEHDDEMERIFEDLRDAYDGNSGVTRQSKSGIIKLAIRVGLQEGSEATIESLEEAISRRTTTTV